MKEKGFEEYGRLQDMAIAYYISQTLNVAIELEVFTKLSGKKLTAKEASEILMLQLRPAEMLLNACMALDLLDQKGDLYYNTPLAEAHLVKGKPGYYGYYVTMMVELAYDAWGLLKEALIRNQPVTDFFPEKVKKDPETARMFTIAVHDSARSRAEVLLSEPSLDLSHIKNMLDIGGGSGGLAIAFAERYTHLEVTLLDLPKVCDVANEFISQSKAASRIKFYPGDFLEDELPKGYDAAIISNVLHILGVEQCKKLLKKAFISLNPSGILTVLDVYVRDDKRGPLMPALFALTMFLITKEGTTYRGSEVRNWLEDLGFVDVQQRYLIGPYSIILCRKPKS